MSVSSGFSGQSILSFYCSSKYKSASIEIISIAWSLYLDEITSFPPGITDTTTHFPLPNTETEVDTQRL